MSIPESEFEHLTKRYELARDHMRHESDQINQRSNRLFGVQAGLLAAYGLVAGKVVPISGMSGRYFMACIGLLGAGLTWALTNEIKGATDAATDVHRWWEKQPRSSQAKLTFPPLQLQPGDKTLPYDPKRNERYFKWTKLFLLLFWGGSVLFAFFFDTSTPVDSAAPSVEPTTETPVQSASDEKQHLEPGAGDSQAGLPADSSSRGAAAAYDEANAPQDDTEESTVDESSQQPEPATGAALPHDNDSHFNAAPVASAIFVATFSIVIVVGKLLSHSSTEIQ